MTNRGIPSCQIQNVPALMVLQFSRFLEILFLTMAGRIYIIEIVFQNQDVSFLRIVLSSLRSANQHDLWLVMYMEHGMLWS